MMRLVIVAVILLLHGVPARAALLWNWSYSGTGVSASGTFTTNDAPDRAGYYQIIRITGAENGVAIVCSRQERRSRGTSPMRSTTW